jgi:hypothetical protein
MRSEIGKLLRQEFGSRMRAETPEFAEQKPKAPCYWPGERVFVRNVGASMPQLLILSPHGKGHDSFTVEIGWSRLGRLPELSTRPSIPRDEPPFGLAEYLTRLGSLDEPLWDFLPIGAPLPFHDLQALNEALAKQGEPIDKVQVQREIAAHLDRVFNALRRVGIPFLAQAEAFKAD